MKWEDWSPTRFSVLCSRHFEERFVDRTGKSVTLREDAVPTIFSSSSSSSSSDDTQRKTASVNPRRKRPKTSGAKASEKESAESSAAPSVTAESKELNQAEEEGFHPDQRKMEKWRIIVDERLMKIESFPHFFHGDYCAPQNIQWAPDDDVTTNCNDSDNVIEVSEPWRWLGLDVRGPLPQTANGHRYLLTLTDYHSRWVEAAPMPSCLPSHVAESVADVVSHFGFPVRILSRLPHDVVHKINRELKDQLKVRVALLVYHQQTGTADLMTPQLIDRMVSDLAEEHAADWDVYLPARVFSLCFKEHPVTKQRPFSALFCRGLEPVRSPRGLSLANAVIQDSAFVIR
ncbi:uncharacterized protein zgc:153292 isoform X2 [Kryptolebias marmoratus]|nr:uncharacterized protein zgc:153292 isoform X2 [Kryptolebias marmoratus]XP_024862426.1 uncharacterized protein zgc:153292 isoform X2 [Kryptolebias marmoratus]